MDDTLTCIAWGMRLVKDGRLHDERQIMLIGEYVVVGTRVMKGVDAIQYNIYPHPNIWAARARAIDVTEGFEKRGLVLHIGPISQPAKKDAAAVRAWLEEMRHAGRSRKDLREAFDRVVALGTPLDGAA